MLTLTRRVGESVFLDNRQTGLLLCVVLKSLHGGTAELQVLKLPSREELEVRRLDGPGKHFDLGEIGVFYNRMETSAQLRIGFDAPDHIHIRRDNIKHSSPKGSLAA